MGLDRHGCKLQIEWLAEAYNHEAVILVFPCFSPTNLEFFTSQPNVFIPPRESLCPGKFTFYFVKINTRRLESCSSTGRDREENCPIYTLNLYYTLILSLSRCFYPVFFHIQMLWELVLLGEALVVMAPSPAESSDTVLALVR